MSDKRAFTRDQLRQFLPDERAIRAFEKLMGDVNDVIPSSLVDALALLGSGKAPNIDRALKRIEELEVLVSARTQNLDAIIKRIDVLEALQHQRPNESSLIKRIEALEKLVGV